MALMWTPPPSHPSVVACGLVLLGLCGIIALSQSARAHIGVFSALLLSLAGLAMLAVRAENKDETRLPLAIGVSHEGCALSITGEIREDFYWKLRDALQEHPRVRTVILNSSGGTAFSITHAASLLKAQGIETAIMRGQCASACAFLWASASRRIITAAQRPIKPAFHAPHVPIPGIGPVRASIQEWQQRSYLRRQVRLPEGFIDRAYGPILSAWRPDLEELNALGVPAEFIPARRLRHLDFCGGRKPV